MATKSSDILNDLRAGNKAVLAQVYTEYRQEFIQWIISTYDCEFEEARDIYQQVILIFYENVVSKKLAVLTSSVKTYLFSIGKNKYMELSRSQKRYQAIPLAQNESAQPVDDMKNNEARLNLIEDQLIQLGDPCRSLLIHFYYHRQPIGQLTEKFGYKNIGTAKNQKYKCLERLRKMVLEKQSLISNEDL